MPPHGAPRRALAPRSRFCDDPALGWWIKGLVTMELKRCLFVGLLALSSAGTAAAKDMATQDPTAPHATLDSASHDGGGSDAASANHDCPLPGNAADSSDSNDSGGSSAANPHAHASHHSSLGWQSLLPGSIQ